MKKIFVNGKEFISVQLAFIGLYLSSIAGIVSYFPDCYVNGVVIGTVRLDMFSFSNGNFSF